MRSLVTGGAGFIGSHLVDSLISRGDEVAVLDDLSTGSLENLRDHLTSSQLRFTEGSILDVGDVTAVTEGVDRVFHLAAVVGVANVVNDPILGMKTNVRGTEILLERCAEIGCKFLFASTSEIYGKSLLLPMAEDDERVLGSTKIPRWSYSTGKALDEHLTLAYADKGLHAVIVRYFNAYGPRVQERGYGSVVANFLRQAHAGEPLTVHGDGKQTRCFTYVDDSVAGTLPSSQNWFKRQPA
jgi:UDP-glucose 4-epimerase